MQTVIGFNRGLSREVDFVLDRGMKFFNRLFTTSLQKSFTQNIDSRTIEIKEQMSPNLGGLRSSFFDITLSYDEIISSAYHFYRDGSFKKELKLYKDGSWQSYDKEKSLFFINGKWQDSYSSYRLDSGAVILDEVYKIETLNSKDISGNYQLNGLDLNMPSGAKIYTNSIEQLKKIATLNRRVSDLTIDEFIRRYSKKEWFDGFRYGGISFGDISKSRRAGKIWYLFQLKGKTQIASKDAGEWRVESYQGSEVLVVKLREQKDIIFANIDGSLYQGEILKKRKIVRHYYNKEAFKALKKVIKEVV
jgi:hypothetical protein